MVVFLPLVGGGLFGLALGAGPLPILGNLALRAAWSSGWRWALVVSVVGLLAAQASGDLAWT